MRKLNENKNANVQLILMAVVAAVVIAISVLIIFPVIGGLDTTTIDAKFTGSTPSLNASTNLVQNLETFYSISPIYIVVLAAVGIIGAIMMIVVTRK